MTATMNFNAVLETASDWVDAVASELGVARRRSGYAALRATLHAIRDSLDMERAVQLGDELPILIRGLYYESWVVGEKPPRILQSADFMDTVRHTLRGHTELSDPMKTVQATLAALGKLLPPHDLGAVMGALPSDIRQLYQAKEESA